MFPFLFGNNFIKKKETFKSFSPQLLEDYRILGNRMAKGYQFDTKWVCPMGSYAWDIQVFFSRNDVAPHFSNRTLEYPMHNFPRDRLILHQTVNSCPSCSQDLNLPDYFLRGYLKDRVCENNSQTREDITRRKIRRIPQECSIELSTILMFNLLLCCHTVCCCAVIQQCGAWNEHSINYWKNIVKHY